MLRCRMVCIRQIYVCDVFGDSSRVSLRQIRQHYDRQLIVNVARDGSLETLPSAIMADHPVPVPLADEPAKAVAILVRLAVFQLRWSPHLIEARSRQQSLGVQSRIPLCQVEDGEI